MRRRSENSSFSWKRPTHISNLRFLSVRYSADLCRSRLVILHVDYWCSNLQTSLEKQNKEQFEEIKSLFKFCQGLAHVWDQHEAGLAQQERTMQENLDANRNRNDAINQVTLSLFSFKPNLEIYFDIRTLNFHFWGPKSRVGSSLRRNVV